MMDRKSTDREILLERIERDNEALPSLRAKAEAGRDPRGIAANMFGATMRGLSIAEFVINRDRNQVLQGLTECARIALSLFERADRGEPIDWSFLTLLAYQDVFDALAVGDLNLGKALAKHIGRQDKKVREKVHPFDIALGYCLLAFVLRDETEMPARVDAFAEACEKGTGRDFHGYVQVFCAVLAGDSAAANAGFVEVLKGHRRQCKGNGIFRFTPDKHLCVWGLGLANLARHYGLNISICDPLIPSELLV